MNARPTHRVEMWIGVQARDDGHAEEIAREFYDRFAQATREIDGCLWLFPVATVRPDPFPEVEG